MNKRLFLLIASVLAISAAACRTSPGDLPAPSVSPTIESNTSAPSGLPSQAVRTATASPPSLPALQTTPGRLAIEPCESPVQGLPAVEAEAREWYQYVNETYGFSFIFPLDWTLSDNNENFLSLCPTSTPGVHLSIGFRRATKAITIQRTGTGAGVILTEGKTRFLDQEISRDILRYQGKDKTVLYNYGTEIYVGDLVFTLSLDNFGTEYEAVVLPESIQAAADAIVESFEPVNGNP